MNINYDELKLAFNQLWEDTKNECGAVKNILIKEFKTLIVITLFTFFLILFSLIIDTSWDFQTIITQFLDKIFSWNIGLSIICTGLSTTIYKLVKNRQIDKAERERYYWVSSTFLDRVAAIFLSSLGIGLAILIFMQIFYNWLDNGSFQNSFTRFKLFLIFLILTSFFFGMNIIFKYFSEEIKKARIKNQINNYVPIVFAILYTLFFLIPSLLIKYLK